MTTMVQSMASTSFQRWSGFWLLSQLLTMMAIPAICFWDPNSYWIPILLVYMLHVVVIRRFR